MKKISVIMSVHNGENYLDRCIQSLINQSMPDFELLIMNDGSKDKTWEIILAYSEMDKRIKLFNNSYNLGLTKCLNKMLDVASGDFVARIDVDDISYQKRLENQISFLEDNKNCDMVVGCSRIVDQNGKELYGICPAKDFLQLKWSLIFRNNIRHSAVMWRKKINHKYDENFYYCQDYEMWCRIIRNGHEVGILHELVSDIYEHTNAITSKMGERQEEMACMVTKKQVEFYLEKEITDAQSKNMRLIYAQKSGLQAKQFQHISTKEIKETISIYLNTAERFFEKEMPNISEFAEEIAKDLNLLISHGDKDSILIAIHKWFDEYEIKSKFKSVVNDFFLKIKDSGWVTA